METARRAQSGTGLRIYLTIATLLLILSILSGFSIGLFIIPIPLVMFGSTAVWGRPWLVAALVAGIVAGSVAYLLTAPLMRFERSSVTIGDAPHSAGLSGCNRAILPDVPVQECDDARTQAFAIAGISSLIVGLGTGLSVRAVVRSRPR